MKTKIKVFNILAGIIFLWRAVNGVRAIVFQATRGFLLFRIDPIYLVMELYEIIVLSIMGVFALRQKKRGKVLNGLGIVYIGYTILNIIKILRYGFSPSTLIDPVILIAALFFLEILKTQVVKQQKYGHKQKSKFQSMMNS